MTIFKNQYWTRIIAVYNHDPRADTKWPIGPDLSDEYDVMFQIDEDLLPELNIQFDHVAFCKMFPSPSVDDWRLTDEELEKLGKTVTKIREQIDGKVETQKKDGAGENAQVEEPVDPDKIKLSTRACNPEGLLEKEILEREQRDKFPCYNYKKRKLFQLTTDEIEKIVHSCLKEYLGQDEVARKYRVSRYLVSKLVC